MAATTPDVLVQGEAGGAGSSAGVALELGKSARHGWIDGARGLSIVAMIVSHVGLVTGLTPGWFHLYVMRPIAPMFLLLLGMLWRPGFRRRHVQFAAALVASQLLAVVVGFAFPNIFVLIGMALLALPLAVRFPHVAIALAVTQLSFWPMPDWWTGYQPGFVLALVTVGALIPADGAVRAFGRLGQLLRVELVGRRPMTFYLTHLVVLAVAVEVVLRYGH